MDTFLWWSGAALWLVAGSVSILFAGEKVLDWALTRLGMKLAFLQWVLDRAKARHEQTEIRG
jgi:hypothetical protein